MNNRYRMHTYKGFILRFKHRSVHIETIRIRSIQHHYPFTTLGSSFHHIMQSGYVCIESCSHILNIKHQHIYIGKISYRRFFILSIQRHYRNTRLGINFVIYSSTCFSLSSKTMLWTKYCFNIHTLAYKCIH